MGGGQGADSSPTKKEKDRNENFNEVFGSPGL